MVPCAAAPGRIDLRALPQVRGGVLAADGGVRTLCVLPDGAVALDVVEVCGYLAPDGTRSYTVRCSTDAPLSTIVGLFRLGEHAILEQSDQWET